MTSIKIYELQVKFQLFSGFGWAHFAKGMTLFEDSGLIQCTCTFKPHNLITRYRNGIEEFFEIFSLKFSEGQNS